MANELIRKKAKQAGVALWRIADELKISEATLTRKMRRELTAEEQQKYLKIIDRLERSLVK